MAIFASDSGNSFVKELAPEGVSIARCYSMIHVGTIEQEIMGEKKWINKVRIGFELPSELRIFKEEKGEQPIVISKEYTLSLSDKSKLRPMLESWRGKKFTEEEAKRFDITNLLGKVCQLNIIHAESKQGVKYADISSITPLMKGVECPAQINETFLFDYENFDIAKFNSLPDFLKDQISKSKEYNLIISKENSIENALVESETLPF